MSAQPVAVVGPLAQPTAGTWTEVATEAQIAAQVEGSARGAAPFALAVKANVAVRGFAPSAACRVLDVAPAEHDAPVVAALREHGAIVVGTTNMHELAFGIVSGNASYGPVCVPGHAGYSAGGSSGGSAAAVASGEAVLAVGTDTGGSVSIPSSHCGVVGFRPTVGRWPSAGLVGLSWTRDTPGIFARTVAEVVQADAWVTGLVAPPALAARPRLGVPREFLDDLAGPTLAAFDDALAGLAGVCELVDVSIADVLELTRRAEMPVVGYEAPRELGAAAARTLDCTPAEGFAALTRGAASPDVAAILGHLASAPVTDDEYARAVRDTFAARARMAELFAAKRLDALVFPTTPAPAPPLGTGETVTHKGREVSTFELYTRHTGQGTMLAAPMVTVPVTRAGGELPVGVTVQGLRGSDAAVLALAALVESVV